MASKNVAVFSSYFDDVWKRGLVANAREHLKGVEFDTVIGRGLSGTIAVTILGRALHKNVAIVRKDTESHHSFNEIEGKIGERWLFVDDFISLGKTRKKVLDAVAVSLADYNRNRNWEHAEYKRLGYWPQWVLDEHDGKEPKWLEPMVTEYVGSYLYETAGDRKAHYEAADAMHYVAHHF